MFQKLLGYPGLIVVAAILVGSIGAVHGETTQDKFYRAYHLEEAKNDCASASKLYAEVVRDPSVDPQMQAEAKQRLAGCVEELACTDFARLMPPNALAYAEIKRPGDQLIKLLDQVGLLAGSSPEPAGGAAVKKLAVSPVLIKELLGIRGAAIAVTGFDPFKQKVAGVLVFHPGSLDVIRGLIETGLPVGGKPLEPIGGFPTYDVEGQAIVTLTSRLVVVSMDRSQIEGVVRRLKGEEKSSLATSDGLAAMMKGRDDSLLFFAINAKPVMPIIDGLIATAGAQSPEMAVAQAVLDLNSLQALTGKAGMNNEGLFFDLTLRLNEGHRNLVFHLLRTPPIQHDMLKWIPEGAAGFVAGALNPARPAQAPVAPAEPGAVRFVTLMDFGREFFANIGSVAVCALPSPEGETSGPAAIPHITAIMTVADAAQSQALWTQVLGIASLANGGGALEGGTVDMAGTPVRTFRFPNGPTIHVATEGNDVVISSTAFAMQRSLQAKHGGKSVVSDPAFSRSLARLTPNTTTAFWAHPGRCMDIAKPFLSSGDAAEMEPFRAVLTDTVASLVVDHSLDTFHMSMTVDGLPKVGGLVSAMLIEQSRKQEAHAKVEDALRRKKWDEALQTVDALLAENPDGTDLLKKKFTILAEGKKAREAALACADVLFEKTRNQANALNNFAWELLTEDKFQGAYAALALKFSQRSNELTDQKSWAYVDTLALAKFATGDVENAVALQKKAIELSDGKGMEAMKKSLERYEGALANGKKVSDAGS